MRDDLHRWQADGLSVALVGSGTQAFAEAFIEDFELEVPVLVDPDLVAFRAAGLRRGLQAIASPRLFSEARRAFRGGARQQSVQGDAWQLGGAFVFDVGGTPLFVHRAESAGDHADPRAIESALLDPEPHPAVDPDAAEASPWAPFARTTRPLLDLSPVGSFDRLGFARHAAAFDPRDLDVDLHGRRVLVTGANSGIGFASALALADLGADVTLLCRSETRGREALEQIVEATGNRRVELARLDVSDLDDVDRFAHEWGDQRVDVLIHNAGVLPDERVETPQGLELTWATHVAGPHRLTALLEPALGESDDARVVWVSSGGGLTRRLQTKDPQWERRSYDGVLAYAETKRAQIVLAEAWAERLAEAGGVSNAMHPGWADTPAVRTSLPRFHAVTSAILRTPEEGADTVIWLAASAAGRRRTGAFFLDREVARTHWIPSTVESRRERAAFLELCESCEAPPREEDPDLAAGSVAVGR